MKTKVNVCERKVIKVLDLEAKKVYIDHLKGDKCI